MHPMIEGKLESSRNSWFNCKTIFSSKPFSLYQQHVETQICGYFIGLLLFVRPHLHAINLKTVLRMVLLKESYRNCKDPLCSGNKTRVNLNLTYWNFTSRTCGKTATFAEKKILLQKCLVSLLVRKLCRPPSYFDSPFITCRVLIWWRTFERNVSLTSPKLEFRNYTFETDLKACRSR